MAARASAKAQFNAPATDGKNHCLIRVERAVFTRLGRFSQRTMFDNIKVYHLITTVIIEK